MLRKGLQARLRSAQDECVNIVGAFVGVDHLKIHHMTNHAIFIVDSIATQHIAGCPGNIEGLAAVIALHD